MAKEKHEVIALNNTEDLRSVLLDTIKKVRNKQIEPRAAQSISNLSHQILQSARLDLIATKFMEGSKVQVKTTKLLGK